MIKIIKKKIKLGIFFLMFIIIAPALVLYANGDIFGSGWSLLKTGGIYINSAPINSGVYINSKLKDSTSFFERDLLIKNLKSGLYDITVKKEGYNTWSKKINVLDNLVSDANVFMLPKKIEVRDIPKDNFIDSKKGTTTVKIKESNEEYNYILSLFSDDVLLKNQKIASSSFSNKNLGTEKLPIMDGKIGLWRDKEEVFVSWYGKTESAPKYFCNKGICVKTIQIFNFKTEPIKIDFLPGYEGVIVVASKDEVFAMQIEDNSQKEAQTIYKGENLDFRIVNGVIYVKDNDTVGEVLL